MEVKKRLRSSIEDPELLFPDPFPRSDLIEQIGQGMQRRGRGVLHGE